MKRHDHVSDDGSLVLHVSKGKALIAMLMSIGLSAVIIAAIILTADTQRANWYWLPVVVASALLCFGMCVLALLRLFLPAPIFVVTHEGLIVDAQVLGPGLIKWSEICGLDTYKVLFQTQLRIGLSDPLAVVTRQPRLRRVLTFVIKGDMIRSGGVTFGDGMLPLSMAELLRQMQRRFHHELAEHRIVVRTDR